MSGVLSLTILVRAVSMALCVAILRRIRQKKFDYFVCVATWVVMIAFSVLLFREVAEFVDGVVAQDLEPQVDPEILERLLSATAGLLTIAIIHRLLIQRQESEEQRRILDTELAHVSRVSTAGVMMSGITHELAQPLSAIANYSAALRNMLRKEPASWDDSLKESNDRIGEEAFRAASILGEIRGFVVKNKPKCILVDLNDLIHEAVQLARFSGKLDQISLGLVLSAKESLIKANPIEITQVIVNLILNACESFDEVYREECIVTLATTVDRPNVVLSVTDNGPGLSTEVMGRMYDSFFTTKPHGMGMGLAICSTILARHKGDLFHVSGMPRGASLTVLLPLAEMGT